MANRVFHFSQQSTSLLSFAAIQHGDTYASSAGILRYSVPATENGWLDQRRQRDK